MKLARLKEVLLVLREMVPAFLLAVLFCAAMAFMVYAQAVAEAETYNRITGADVTWWDAIWIEFRVSDGAVR